MSHSYYFGLLIITTLLVLISFYRWGWPRLKYLSLQHIVGKLVLGASEDVVIALNARHEVIFFNQAAQRACGGLAYNQPITLLSNEWGLVFTQILAGVMPQLEVCVAARYYTLTRFKLSYPNAGQVFLFHDITDYRQTLESLHNNEQQFRMVIEHFPLPLVVARLSGEVITANPAFCNLLGYSMEAIKTKRTFDFYAFPELDRHLVLTKLVQEGRLNQWEVSARKQDGTFLDVLLSAYLLHYESELVSLSVIYDLTKTKQTTEELRKFSRAVEQSHITIVITNHEGTVEYVNPHFTTVTGYDREEILGQNYRLLQSGQTPLNVYQNLWRTITQGQVWQGELLNKTKHGVLYWEATTISPVKNEQGVVTHYLAIKEDVTERKQLYVELEQAKEAADAANKAKSLFLANVSHELRTPLNAILGYTQHLKRDPHLPQRYVTPIDVIHQSGNHLLMLINDVLDLAKIDAGKIELKPREVNLLAFLEGISGIIYLRAYQKGLMFVYEVDPHIPTTIMVDEMRLRQALLNLLSNAVKFTAKGQVTFKVESCEQLNTQTALLRFTIADTGVGLAAYQLEQIFQPFKQMNLYSPESEGTGLGLPLSKQIIELMGGFLHVESIEEYGTLFWFELRFPVLEETHHPSHHQVAGYEGDLRHILVVDDKLDNRLALEALLEQLGFKVTLAEGGLEALQHLKSVRPDLVLLDLVMPDMTGFETMQQLRSMSEFETLPIIAISASMWERGKQAEQISGFDDFLPKPVQLADLLSSLGSVLNLTWRYTVTKTAVIDLPATLTLPSTQQLETLHELVMFGDMSQIERWANNLAEEDHTLTAFAHQVSHYAANYEDEVLLKLLHEALKTKNSFEELLKD